MSDEYLVDDPHSAFYGTRWFATLPLILMLAPVIVLSFFGVLTSEVLVASGIIGISIGSFFSRNKKEYFDVVIKALCDPMGLMVFGLFLLVGIYGELLTTSGLTEGIVWLSQQLELGPGDSLRCRDTLPVAGAWSGGLANNREQITLQSGNVTLQQFTYDDDWHPSTDGDGYSLVLVDPRGPRASWS